MAGTGTKRQVFYSLHYEPDSWRASIVRQIGAIEGNVAARANEWEEVKRGGERAIRKWIDDNLHGRSCTVVLIGANTAKRKWIDYEIENSWNNSKGVVGIHIHGLKDSDGNQSTKGANPFAHFTIGEKKIAMSSIVKTYDPLQWDSKAVYKHIADNISGWIEEAITIRGQY